MISSVFKSLSITVLKTSVFQIYKQCLCVLMYIMVCRKNRGDQELALSFRKQQECFGET